MSVPTFIVGTGRCGSTMLSNMLRDHAKVLSRSDCLAPLNDDNPEALSSANGSLTVIH